MKKTLITTTAALIALFILCTGCNNSAADTESERPIQIALTQDILSFDPIRTTDIFSEALHRCIYTSLFDFDTELTPQPKLAKNIEIIDNYTWLIEIHNTVLFHDGTPLTADDVVFSIERALTGERTQKMLEMVESVEKKGDYHFAIKSKEPYLDLPSLFAKAETSIVSKAAVQTDGYDFSMPVGAGPYKLLSRKQNEIIRLERFQDYYLEPAASRFLDFVVIVTEQERTAAFFNGDVDMLFSVSAYDCDKIRVSNGLTLYSAPSTKIEYLSLNNTHPPLDNPKVRLALNYAINRNTITDHVYHGYSVPSASLIPEGVIGYVPDIIEYNPDKARRLLQEAGFEDGFEFNVIAINTIRKNTLEYIKLDLAKVGVKLNYSLITMKQAVDMMNANEHDSILVGWAYNSDPNSVLPLVLGSDSGKTMNSSRYSNPLVDELLIQARSQANVNDTKKIYERINNIVVTDSPIIILQNPMVLCAAQSSIGGVQLTPQGLFRYESLYRKD